ncbi:MAG TPA: hypothetical protein VFA12_19995 [Stellaceae bacterium]|nr:hypothetical protein [Stellaceae bacterium]
MIRLQFSTQRGLSSALIRWFGHLGPFTHVDAIMRDTGPRQGWLLGARWRGPYGRGVQIRPPDYAVFSRRLVVDIPVPWPREQWFYRYLRDQLGKPYDISAILGFASGRDWRADDSWFCSELIAAALEAAGVFARPLCCQVNKIDPDDLLLALSMLVPIAA